MTEYSLSSAADVTGDREQQGLLVTDEDEGSSNQSSQESVDVSEEETPGHVDPSIASDVRRAAFEKPSLSLTMVSEDEDGNLTVQTQEYDVDKQVTVIIDNEGSAASEEDKSAREEEGGSEEPEVRAPSSSSVRTRASQSRGMKRRMGIIVSSSDSEDEDFITKLSLMPLKSDDTPVLTIPLLMDDGCLTDVENLEDE